MAFALKEKARQLGFTLAGIALPEKPVHLETYHDWLQAGRHATMDYLGGEHAVEKRADPHKILPECRSILVLGMPYFNPLSSQPESDPAVPRGRIAAYAWGDDYHLVLPERLNALVAFLEELVAHPIPNRYYTDTGPILERDLAMRAGLGWIGKNTCLINPRQGSYFLLAEILLGIDLPPDEPFNTDHCGSCTRCIETCPTGCILPDRTLDSARCISYLTIENKGEIPVDLRPLTGEWIFGCDICQLVCPWNIRFAQMTGDPAFAPRTGLPAPSLAGELALKPQEFNQKYRRSPLKRAKRRGYLRNVVIAAGNSGEIEMIPVLKEANNDPEALVREPVGWALRRLQALARDVP
ncbi:MAG TPA: tRNA epoxyqueuosine(34) reductase QueG [Anaerolineales bacterium]